MNESIQRCYRQRFIFYVILLITGRARDRERKPKDFLFYCRAISVNNAFYIIGGRYASTGRLSNAVFKYDAEIDFWRTCDSMKAPR